MQLTPDEVVACSLRASTLRLFDPGVVPVDALLTSFSLLGWSRDDLFRAVGKFGLDVSEGHVKYADSLGPYADWDEAVVCLLSEQLYNGLARIRAGLSIDNVVTRSLG